MATANPLLALATLDTAGRADRARHLGPRRSPLHQQPVVLRPRALQRRRRRHAGSHRDAAPRARHAAAAQRRLQSPVALRHERHQRAAGRLQPADATTPSRSARPATTRRRCRSRARSPRSRSTRAARPASRAAACSSARRATPRPTGSRTTRGRSRISDAVDDLARRAHLQGRRRVPQHRLAVPVPRQQRDHLRRHQRVHRQPPDAGGGLARIAGLHAAAGTTSSASRRTPGASAAG